jgi:very-short-patch-repair endonuclease
MGCPENGLWQCLSRLSAPALGVFAGRDATQQGVSRKQLAALRRAGVIERAFSDTYRITAVARSNEQLLRAALLWAGEGAAAAGRSAGELYGLEGVRAGVPEIVVPRSNRPRSAGVVVHRATDRTALMLRRHNGLMTTGVETTLLALAATLDEESFEIAYEDARRRRLVSVPGLRAYLARFGRAGRPGVTELRRQLRLLDPNHASRSTLEVKTRRLLVAHGYTNFVREFPLDWNGRTYRFDFAFERQATILETNGRRWHDDSLDYEHDNDKWSVPGRHGYRIVFATWLKVAQRPSDLLAELATTLSKC